MATMQDHINFSALLYCVICLLIIITILLLIILLKKYCKKCSAKTPESNIEGGTFRMSDLKRNSEHDSPDKDTVNHSNNLQNYTACSDDSSSTSSESLCHSYGDKPNDNNQQYMSLKTPLQGAYYENISEGKSTSALDYENKKPKKNRDYVNVEQQNMPLTRGRKSKSERHQEDQDESQTSSESSSDESDDDSVNYSTIVFKEATNTVQREH
ncbi:hypothetical protein PHYPO_G00113270 [Pangasianodon hypophthalmus]|uniref:Uncharacterized protein n=2 Tax=Pangasianodon hypophthalmus TaxID=310915 RepID=A0A5N5L4D8_PANHP|nr:uncharacterized G-patch domain protein DDB_G0278987 isoform X1 [Pangasianodon hypophthalmus]KAB5536956.1 hypothetical protein PHYPO_G00113270 [Pangasianodon hypophthalmus]